jgi:hypothetical protein
MCVQEGLCKPSVHCKSSMRWRRIHMPRTTPPQHWLAMSRSAHISSSCSSCCLSLSLSPFLLIYLYQWPRCLHSSRPPPKNALASRERPILLRLRNSLSSSSRRHKTTMGMGPRENHNWRDQRAESRVSRVFLED